MHNMLQDLVIAARGLRRSPGFAFAAILTLALGIGANTAIFSVVDRVMIRQPPVAGIEKLAMIWQTDRNTGTTREAASVPDLIDFRQRSTQLQSIEAMVPAEVNLTLERGDPRRVASLQGTVGLIPLLGVTPIAGGVFQTEADGVAETSVALISERLWQSAFNRDPAAIGRTVRLNDAPHRIIGVMPRDADFGVMQILGASIFGRTYIERRARTEIDIWTPYVPDASSPRHSHTIMLIGQLADGATIATASSEMSAIAADLELAHPENAARGVFVEPLRDVIFAGTSNTLFVLMGAVVMVLLVACSNVANLMLARHAARSRELTVRIALGASQARLVRQYLAEAAVLVFAGALLGVVIADGALRVLVSIAPPSIPGVHNATIDMRVIGATTVVATLVAVAIGLLPMFQSRGHHVQAALQSTGSRGVSGARHQKRWRSILVVAELSLAVALMVCAGLLVRSLWQLQHVNPGFSATGVLKAEYQLPAARYPRDMRNFPNWAEQQQFNQSLVQKARALPGVDNAAVAVSHPLDGGFGSSIVVVGREAEAADWPEPAIRMVGAGYFETMHVAVHDGRAISAQDDPMSSPVLLVNEAAKRRFFADSDPIGQQVFLWGARRRIVGVVGNERFRGLDVEAVPAIYVPITQVPSRFGNHTLLVRTSGSIESVAPAVASLVRTIDPQLPLFGVEPLEDTIAGSLAKRRFTMILLGSFAALALIIAMIGVHGVLNYLVTLRTREIGIRVALGAEPARVQRDVVREGFLLVLIGLAVGMAGALATGRVLSSLVYGVGTADPVSFIGTAIILGTTALVACAIPARRAAHVDPMVALRND